MQEATGIPLMTIRTWAANGVIVPRKTSQHAATILRAAQDRGIDLKADDLIDTEVPA
jgi:DNA-binding transcriptional MerR regulator